MNTSEKVAILSEIITRDEAGTHFTALHACDALAELEEEGLIEITRPVHEFTGIPYSQEYWSVEITDDGMALLDANPELIPE